ncbi:hypothetical protein L2E82_45999 [Cichorium intybus]|uniref:Uncharacterized protein n=1 Tax=Cichorium intybus TaxID=13427 RepID=A0ACB8ZUI8_CICIN|nr:hypothetical protein L2E82_45999 [Cichorium intybus]
MILVWQYEERSGYESWKGLSWGMVPVLLGGAFCACAWHFFYNSESLEEFIEGDVSNGALLFTAINIFIFKSMSYAKLAGLQPIYGLYTGFVPVFVYAIFGSSRQLAVGPVALVSLLVSNVLGNIDSSAELYTELAILLSLMVGILECTMGLLRLGWLIRFISHSVISGFTTASAFVIGLSQAKYFLGYDVSTSSQIIPLVKSIIEGADKFSWPPFVMWSSILAIILVMKHLGKTRKSLRFLRAGGPLTAVVLGTAFVKIFHPSSISLESVGIAKALAAKNGYELDSNQELFGLGVVNICGSFFSAYPSTGSFTRSAVNHESGAKTGLSGIIMGIIMACALLFMTPLFEFIPQNLQLQKISKFIIHLANQLKWIILIHSAWNVLVIRIHARLYSLPTRTLTSQIIQSLTAIPTR